MEIKTTNTDGLMSEIRTDFEVPNEYLARLALRAARFSIYSNQSYTYLSSGLMGRQPKVDGEMRFPDPKGKGGLTLRCHVMLSGGGRDVTPEVIKAQADKWVSEFSAVASTVRDAVLSNYAMVECALEIAKDLDTRIESVSRCKAPRFLSFKVYGDEWGSETSETADIIKALVKSNEDLKAWIATHQAHDHAPVEVKPKWYRRIRFPKLPKFPRRKQNTYTEEWEEC